MQIFTITKKLKILCEASRTRNGFKHTATLLRNGMESDEVKINYLNRTWERYDFESVLKKLAEAGNFTPRERAIFKKKIAGQFRAEDPALKNLKTISAIASLGDLFGQTKKEKNDWKERMLKAGLEGQGLIMPEDWDTLTEDQKEKRLNGAIDQLK